MGYQKANLDAPRRRTHQRPYHKQTATYNGLRQSNKGSFFKEGNSQILAFRTAIVDEDSYASISSVFGHWPLPHLYDCSCPPTGLSRR